MRCPYCKNDEDKVVDSRAASEGEVIRRRRECLDCGRRFTTYERVEEQRIRVVKKDGSRVPFEREKILTGLMRACEKRPVSTEALDDLVRAIDQEIHDKYEREVPAKFIGELAMKKLRKLDEVAYIRFASVYRDFKDVSEFVSEARPMLRGGRKKQSTGRGNL